MKEVVNIYNFKFYGLPFVEQICWALRKRKDFKNNNVFFLARKVKSKQKNSYLKYVCGDWFFVALSLAFIEICVIQ